MEPSIKITTVPRFDRALEKYTKNNQLRKYQVKKTLKLFIQNPAHPSLNTELLKNSDLWTLRINKSDRIFFLWIENNIHALLWDIGSHDKYKKY